MIEVVWVAAGLGLAFNAAPGAVFAESLRRGLRGGFRQAFAVQVGSLLGDAVWATLGLVGVGALFTLPGVRIPLTVGGCLLLCWLSMHSFSRAIAPRSAAELTDDPGGRTALYTGAGMSLSNPFNVIYWSGAAGAVAGILGHDPKFVDLALFFVGFMMSSLAWCFVCAGAIALLHRTLPPVAVRVVEGLCGTVLLGIAILSLAGLHDDLSS